MPLVARMENVTIAYHNNTAVQPMAGATFGDFYHATRLIEFYAFLFICVFGILGNTLIAAKLYKNRYAQCLVVYFSPLDPYQTMAFC